MNNNLKEEVADFLQAVEDKNVCMMGDFCTHIMHDKILFKLLRNAETKAILTDMENAFVEEHVPYTVCLTDEEIIKKQVKETKERKVFFQERIIQKKNGKSF